MVQSTVTWGLFYMNLMYLLTIFIGRTDVEAEAPILLPPDAKSQLIGKDLMLGKIEGKSRRRRQRMKWLDGITTNGHEQKGCINSNPKQ